LHYCRVLFTVPSFSPLFPSGNSGQASYFPYNPLLFCKNNRRMRL
jgi:hypothetical protein